MEQLISRRRAAWHSSAANYDNTAHLVTEGLRGGLGEALEPGWLSAGNGEEWVMIDLGAQARLSKAVVRWGAEYAVRYDVQGSNDGTDWTAPASGTGADNAEIVTPLGGAQARYVRILCREASGARYHIRTVDIWGEYAGATPPAGSVDVPARRGIPDAPPADDAVIPLSGGNWRVRRASEVDASGEALSGAGYGDADWLPAVVPGTVLTSWLAAGAVPDPNYGDWQFQVSDAFFTADFWYRGCFHIPASRAGRRVYLHFDAVNWKADVYFNGRLLPSPIPERKKSIEGAFRRGIFDVTDLSRVGGDNHLAVRVYKNDTPGDVTTQGLAEGPGPNGGRLGADNPTLHASVGWDWLPTIRGRNTGIYGDVYLRFGGGVRLLDPWMRTGLSVTETSARIAAEDLAKLPGVTVTGGAAAVLDGGVGQWIGADEDGAGFIADLGTERTVGSVTLVWGTEAGGAAADLESRHPARFRLERSVDGGHWENIDAYPGGEVDMEWFGLRSAEPNAGTDFFEGHAISDSVQGGTALVPVDMTSWGMGKRDIPAFAPQRARYLKFIATERRALGGKPVPARVRELRVYAESTVQVEQSLTRRYALDASKAELTFKTEIRNDGDKPVTAVVSGRISPAAAGAAGDTDGQGISAAPSDGSDVPGFSQPVQLAPNETKAVEIGGLVLDNPRLWWPNTYGGQHLYACDVRVTIDGDESDRQRFRFGVRRFDTPVDGGILTLYCNGVRIVARGGNWGMDDGMKRDTPRIYDHKVRLHAEANMTMIRNWIGMTHHPAFYEACDKYGILIWDDFWLANPVDGPEPNDPALFLDNAADRIRRNRYHAALALYCGRNEGNPPPELDEGLRQLVCEQDGTRIYFPNSAGAPVGSGGGYSLAWPGGGRGVKQYFSDVTSPVLRSERGIPNVPELCSLRRFVPEDRLWPISETWAVHDWTYHMNGPASSYMAALQGCLGGDFTIPEDRVQGQAPDPADPVFAAYKAAVYAMTAEAGRIWRADDFNRAAQLINYEHHRGLFEALAARRSNGLLMWMSQSSWPSFMWQTYDWYLDTNGGYFGAKAGNQPARAVWDPRDDGILLANATGKAYSGVATEISVYDLNGVLVSARTVTTELLEPDACGVVVAKADFTRSGTALVFLRLILRGGDGTILGENTYWHNRLDYQNYRALNALEAAAVDVRCAAASPLPGGGRRYTLTLVNAGAVPAVQLSLKAFDAGGAQLLPVFFSDNYITLMPGDRKTVTAETPDGAADRFALGGWNIAGGDIPVL